MNTPTTKTPTPEPSTDAGPNCAESPGSAPSALAVEGYMRNRQTLVERLCEISIGPMWNGYDKALKGIREDIAVIDANVTSLLNKADMPSGPKS